MKKAPSVFYLKELFDIARSVTKDFDGVWIPARPIGLDTIVNRVKCAWMVFVGKGDVVVWPEGQ